MLSVLCRFGAALDIPKNASIVLLTLPDGSKVETGVASTPQLKALGLTFRNDLPDDRGMLFVFTDAGSKTIRMKNVFISLDIVFLDADMRITNIYNHVPHSGPDQPEDEIAKVSAPASFVLELAAGKAMKSGLKPGYKIKVMFPAPKKKGAPAPPRK